MTNETHPSSTSGRATDGSREGVGRFIQRRFLIGVAFGVLITAAIIVVSDGRQMLNTLDSVDWKLVPIILLLSLSNYLLRFVKWHLYLH